MLKHPMRSESAHGFLELIALLLKTFQRLGYFVSCVEIPIPIVRHVFRCAAFNDSPEQLKACDTRKPPLAKTRLRVNRLEGLGHRIRRRSRRGGRPLGNLVRVQDYKCSLELSDE
jgi:hypothetical protein